MRADLKWHAYPPASGVKKVEEVLEIVGNDLTAIPSTTSTVGISHSELSLTSRTAALSESEKGKRPHQLEFEADQQTQ